MTHDDAAHVAHSTAEPSAEAFPIPQQDGQFEIVIEVTDSEGALHGNLKYQSDLYTPATAEQMRDAFHELLAAVVADPDARVTDLLTSRREEFEV